MNHSCLRKNILRSYSSFSQTSGCNSWAGQGQPEPCRLHTPPRDTSPRRTLHTEAERASLEASSEGVRGHVAHGGIGGGGSELCRWEIKHNDMIRSKLATYCSWDSVSAPCTCYCCNTPCPCLPVGCCQRVALNWWHAIPCDGIFAVTFVCLSFTWRAPICCSTI